MKDKLRNIFGYTALAGLGAFFVYAYNENRVPYETEGTVGSLSFTQDGEGLKLDTRKPVVLTDGRRLLLERSFNGSIVVGECYRFTILNTVSEPMQSGAKGRIETLRPCAP